MKLPHLYIYIFQVIYRWFYASCNWNEYNLNLVTRNNWRASLVMKLPHLYIYIFQVIYKWFYASCNWNEYNLNLFTRNNCRASLVPAAAVIPAPIGYIKVP